MIKINGEPVNAAGMPLLEWLAKEGYQTERIAIECNQEILPKSEYGKKILQDGDVLEIVSFVGGG